MKTILATAALIAVAATSAQAYSPLRTAVIKYHQANDYVQAAVYIDVCGDAGIMGSVASMEHLGPKSQRTYKALRAQLGVAYAATNQTDGALMQVDRDFCDAVTPR